MHRSPALVTVLAFGVGVIAPAGCSYIARVEPPDASPDLPAPKPDRPPEMAPDINVTPQVDADKFGVDMTAAGLDMNCGALSHEAKMLPADLLIVQDRSLSMTNDKDDKMCKGGSGLNGNCGTDSKWYQVTTALTDVLGATETMVNWGLLYFGAEATMCGVTMNPAVPIATMNASAITQAFVGQPSLAGQAGTPTRSAMINAVTYMKSLTDPNPKFLLLATDGQPNCAPGGSLNTADEAGSEQAVADALTAGFPTFVIGIGNTGGVDVLNKMAIAGGKPVPGAPGGNSFYQVNNTADLEAALAQILGTVTTCVFDIGPPPNDQANLEDLMVFGDDKKIAHDPQNGWDFSNSDKTQVTLYGSVCADVTTTVIRKVSVTFGCTIK